MSGHRLPDQARCVIIGGGIIGTSVAYHLARLGWNDVLLLEQGRLSCGTTWHAAGLVGQLRSHEGMTRLIRYSTELYAGLEAETGLATGWKRCGSLSVARTPERMVQLRRGASMARAQGVEAEILSPKEAGDLWPPMRTDDLAGAIWLPGDGKVNPADLTQALARGARQGGVRIHERVKVSGISTRRGAVEAVETDAGRVKCEVVVNCAGQWAKALGRMCGVNVPLHAAEHMYIVTGPIDGIDPDLPVMRDPDGYVYFKEEVGGLVMGGFEPEAKPWGMAGIPENFEFTLLPDDWDQFEILMEGALQRVPALAAAPVRQFVNGPESFTPDSNFILGEAPEVRNFYVGAGFNSMGIASAGGAGKALAEWVVNGSPAMDLWPVDIRRFARFHGNDRWLHDRVKETLGLHYAIAWPNRELESARPLRRSPLYARLKEAGACFGSKMGWERPNWFARDGEEAVTRYSFGRQNWFDAVAGECRAAREGVALFDQSSFAKFLLQGRDAAAVLNRLCANDIDVAAGRSVYTGMLNGRGGYESDLTVMRLDEDRFMIVTGTAQAVRDFHWIGRHIPAGAHAVLSDVTSSLAVIGVTGPEARTLLSRLSPADLSSAAFPFAHHREIDLGYGLCRANRLSYAGELGWELYIPAEMALGVYRALWQAGQDLGVANAGYYALESLRLEKGYRAWGRELTPDITPWQAGLGFAVAMDKPGGFIGDAALKAARGQGGPRARIVQLLLDDPEPVLWGGELVLRDGKAVGRITSGAYGYRLGAAVGLALVRAQEGIDAQWIAAGGWAVDIAGEVFTATAHLRGAYDPEGVRIRA